jgi:hypothetical protein
MIAKLGYNLILMRILKKMFFFSPTTSDRVPNPVRGKNIKAV